MTFYPGITLLTLGVDDLVRSTAFYERLGWRKSQGASQPSISFFALKNVALALFPRDALAHDCGLDPSGVSRPAVPPFTISQNHADKSAVAAVIEQARAAGAKIVKPASDTEWGGYAGIFADPDGHFWEICFNPYFPLAPDGTVRLPP